MIYVHFAASGEVSVRLSACGWCWAVSGRRVIAWPRTAAAPGAATSTVARELSLPQTDLAHKADLVVLFYTAGAQVRLLWYTGNLPTSK